MTSVLVVDDDPDICDLVAVNLQLEGFDVTVASSGADALDIVVEERPDVVILDVMMPEIDGFEVCRRIRSDARLGSTPVIMLTAMGQPVDRAKGFAAGADDYFSKPFNASELVARVTSLLRRTNQMRDVSPLTGLPGNFQLAAQLDRVVAEPGDGFSVLHFDLDCFKEFNDYYGFLRGDEAIKESARILGEAQAGHRTPHDFLGHIGGDDFVLVSGAAEGPVLAADVLRAFDSAAPLLYDEADRARGYIEVPDRRRETRRYPFLTASIGVATSASRPITTRWEASSIAAEMKAVAKRRAGSAFEVDRRRQ